MTAAAGRGSGDGAKTFDDAGKHDVVRSRLRVRGARAAGMVQVSFHEDVLTDPMERDLTNRDAVFHQRRPCAGTDGNSVVAAEDFRRIKKQRLVDDAGGQC